MFHDMCTFAYPCCTMSHPCPRGVSRDPLDPRTRKNHSGQLRITVCNHTSRLRTILGVAKKVGFFVYLRAWPVTYLTYGAQTCHGSPQALYLGHRTGLGNFPDKNSPCCKIGRPCSTNVTSMEQGVARGPLDPRTRKNHSGHLRITVC